MLLFKATATAAVILWSFMQIYSHVLRDNIPRKMVSGDLKCSK